MIAKYEGGWTFTHVSEDDRVHLEELIVDMYWNERKDGTLSDEKFYARVKETAESIISGTHEEAYIEEPYLVIVPKYGFGTVEIPIEEVHLL
jgi:protein involved in ribonucleotide reduction